MKVAVTGGAGQLGTLIVRRLVAERTVKAVRSIDLRPPMVAGSKLTDVRADIRETRFARHLEGCDALVHCAFVVSQSRPRAELEDINIGGSKNVFLAAAAAGVKTIVYASSVAAYGALPGLAVPLVEDSPRRFHDSFAYSACKFRVEEFLDELEREYPDVTVARMRPGVLVGTRMENVLGRAWGRGLSVDLGGEPMPMVWDEDAADAFVLALKKRAHGAFNLCADDPVGGAELARAAGLRLIRVPRAVARAAARVTPVLAALGLTEPIDPSWLESLDVPYVVSSARAIEVLGWKRRHATGAEVMRRFGEEAPRRLDRRLATFMRLADLGARLTPPDPELRGYNGRIHLCLTGRGGGDFTLLAGGGRVRIESGFPRPPTAVLTVRATTFIDLLAGRSDFAAAQLSGRIRVEGEGMSTMMIGGIVARFRAAAALPGLSGAAARRLAHWMAA